MARTPRTLETPGAPAGAPDAPAPDTFQAVPTDLSAPAEPADPSDPSDLAAVVAQQAKQIEAMMAAMKQMQANAARPVAAMPVAEKHPTLEELGDLSKIKAPTMTDKGLYVPPTFGANPATKG